jgi:excisionase family DNA binding protein
MEELKLYTLREVEKILKVTQRTLYTYIQEGTLKATKIGKYWRVKHADLMDFVDNGNSAKK